LGGSLSEQELLSRQIIARAAEHVRVLILYLKLVLLLKKQMKRFSDLSSL